MTRLGILVGDRVCWIDSEVFETTYSSMYMYEQRELPHVKFAGAKVGSACTLYSSGCILGLTWRDERRELWRNTTLCDMSQVRRVSQYCSFVVEPVLDVIDAYHICCHYLCPIPDCQSRFQETVLD